MKEQRSGRVINIASDLGQLGCENLAHYSAAKGGIIALTKSLARELSSVGVLVNAIAPGGVLTPMVEALGPKYIEEESARYPLKRLGTAREIADVAVFLASEASSFMTGQIVGVNGGGVMNG
jgi:3-oxoacyl-[acyl-carrier protein] reductase